MQSWVRLLLLFALYLGYLMHTYSRRSFQNVINYVIKNKFIAEQSVGLVVTAQQVGYTVSKFTHPLIIDIPNPKMLFCATMFTSFVCLAAFSYCTTLHSLVFIYGLHGFCLAFAWPSLAKMLKQMIPSDEFGFWWAIECTSSNVGAVCGSVLSTLISDKFGWRNSVRFCATANFVCGVFVSTLFCFVQIPRIPGNSKLTRNLTSNLGFWSYLFNPFLMANGACFFTIYLSRYLVSDWYQIYLSKLKFHQLTIASFISAMEIGGTIGSITAGIMADIFYTHLTNWKSPRLFVIIICGMFVSTIQHSLIFSVNAHTSKIFLTSLGFLFGFFIYGPVAVSGIIAIEAAPPDCQGLSFSINVLYANFAMLTAGYPISFLGTKLGWHMTFVICYMLVVSATALLCLSRTFPTPVERILQMSNSADLQRILSDRYTRSVSDWSTIMKIRSTEQDSIN